MSLLAYILFCILVYRHASGRAKYHRAILWIAYIFSLGTVLPAAYFGYLDNPNRKNLKFREVL